MALKIIEELLQMESISHHTDFTYTIQIFRILGVIQSYHVFIAICFKWKNHDKVRIFFVFNTSIKLFYKLIAVEAQMLLMPGKQPTNPSRFHLV